MRRAWCAQRLSRKYVQKKICPHRCSHWLTRSQYMPSQHNQENVSFACVRVPGLGTFPDPTHSRDHVRKEKGYPEEEVRHAHGVFKNCHKFSTENMLLTQRASCLAGNCKGRGYSGRAKHRPSTEPVAYCYGPVLR